jgi:CDP-glycerol glycerophosphotransferase (TagB/SpsB family)
MAHIQSKDQKRGLQEDEERMTSTADHIIEKIREALEVSMDKPLNSADRLRVMVDDPHLFSDYISEDAEWAIESLEALLSALEAAEAERDALRTALEPFKAFADAYDEDQLRRNGVDPRKYDLSDKSTVATSGIFGTSTWRVITAGDCRRARTLAGDNHE